jgi:hypothetical protein
MMISIKKDIKTCEDGVWDFYGAKTEAMELTLENLMQYVIDERRVGLHELLIGDKYKPYADLDYSPKEKMSKCEFETMHVEVLERGFKAMEDLFPDGDVTMLCASSLKTRKISAHFVVDGMFYSSKEEIKHVMSTCDMDALHFDKQVYDTNHTMRLPLCSKPGQTRPLRTAEIVKFKDCGFIKYLEEDIELDFPRGLITYVLLEDKKMPCPKGFIKKVKAEKVIVEKKTTWTDAERDAALLKLRTLIAALASDRAGKRDMWTQGVWAIRRIADKYQQIGAYRALAHDFSKKTDMKNYNEAATDDLYMTEPKEIGVGYKRLKEWADHDTPGWDKPETAIASDAVTYYDKKYEILATSPTPAEMQQWMLGCIRYCDRRGGEEWFQRSTDGWHCIDNRSNFPFSTLSSNSKVGKTTCKDLLEDLKDTEVFQSCMTDGSEFYPFNGVSEKPNIINLFRGWPFVPTPALPSKAVDLFVEHVLMLFGDECGNYVLNTLTRKMLFPREKGKFIVAYGKYGGEGKNALEAIITAVFGSVHCLSTPGTKHILGQGEAGFNALAETALVVFIQEAKADGKSIVCDDKFKTWLSEPVQQIRKMRMDPYNASNYGTAFLWTNNRSCLKMPAPMARRTMAQQVSDAKIDDKEYFDRLWGIMKNPEGLQQIFNSIRIRDISKFNPDDIPQTEFMNQMKEDSLSATQKFIVEAANGNRNLDIADDEAIVDKADFYRDFKAYCNDEGIAAQYVPSGKSFHAELQGLDIICKQRRVEDKRPYCYFIDFKAVEAVMRKFQKNSAWSILAETDETD